MDDARTPHFLRWFLIGLSFFAVVAFVLVVARLVLGGAVGRNLVEQQVENLSVRGQTIDIDGLAGDILHEAQIDTLAVSDAEGVWLRLSDVTLRWRPGALISGKAQIDKVIVAQTSLLREPILEEAPSPQPSERKDPFLKQIVLEELKLPLVTAIWGDLAEPIELSLTAALDIGGTSGSAYLNLDTLNRPQGDTADIDLVWSGERLDGRVDIETPSDGLVMAFAPDNWRSDAKVTFEASGSAPDWQMSGAVSLDSEEVMTLAGNSAGGAAELSLEGNLFNHPLLSPFADRLGDQISARLTSDVSQGRTAPTEVTLLSDRIQARAAGALDLDNQRLATPWRISLATHALAELLGSDTLHAETVTLVGDLAQNRTRWTFDGELIADNLQSASRSAKRATLHIASQWRDRQVSSELDLAIDAPVTGVAQLDDMLSARLDGHAVLDMDIDTRKIQIETLDARGERVRLSGSGGLALAGPTDLEGRIELDQTQSLVSMLSGRAKGDWAISRQSDQAPWRAGLSLDLTDLETDQVTLASLIGASAALNANVEFTQQQGGPFSIRLETEGLDLRTDGTLNLAGPKSPTISAGLSAVAGDIAAPSGQLEGVTLDARIEGNIQQPAFRADARIAQGLVAGRPIEDVKLQLDAVGPGTGRLTTSGLVAGAPLAGSAAYQVSDTWQIDDISLNWSDLNLTGWARGGEALEGQLHLAGPLPLKDIEGDVDAAININGEALALNGKLQGLTVGGLNLTGTNLSVSGTLKDASYTLESEGWLDRNGRKAPLVLAASGDLSNAEEMALTLTASGAFDGETFKTNAPAKLVRSGDNVAVEADLSVLGGAAKLKAQRQSQALSVSLDGSSLDVERLLMLAGRDGLHGTADVTAEWTGRGDKGNGAGQLSLTGFGAAQAGAPDLTVRLAASSDGTSAALDITATSPDALSMTGSVSAPISVANGLPVVSLEDTEVAYAFEGEGKLGAAWALVGIDTIELDGDFSTKAEGRHLLNKLRPNGTFSLRNGRFEQAQLGARMTDIEFDARFTRDVLTLDRASARGVHGGSITADGQLYLDETRPSALAVQFAGFQAIQREGQSVRVSGDANVVKAETGATLSGDLTIDEAVLDITTLNGKSVQTVEVEFPNGDDDTAPAPRESRAPPLNLDVALRAPQQVFVRGKGLDTEMSADLTITGTLAAPIVRGHTDVVRGGFDLAGQFFEFSTGRVDINGDPKTARIDFAASRTTDGVTATLGLVGTASAPRLVMSSTPALPEDEVLSRLLFGRSPSNLSALEAAQLAAAISSMANGGNGGGLVSDLRDSIGLDRLSIGQDDSGAAQLATGKYLSPDVYLELRSRTDGLADVAVEWELRDNITIGTEFQTEGDARVTVQWKKDYE